MAVTDTNSNCCIDLTKFQGPSIHFESCCDCSNLFQNQSHKIPRNTHKLPVPIKPARAQEAINIHQHLLVFRPLSISVCTCLEAWRGHVYSCQSVLSARGTSQTTAEGQLHISPRRTQIHEENNSSQTKHCQTRQQSWDLHGLVMTYIV